MKSSKTVLSYGSAAVAVLGLLLVVFGWIVYDAWGSLMRLYPWTVVLLLIAAEAWVVYAWRCRLNDHSCRLLRLAETCRRYAFLMEQLVKRDFNTKYRHSLLGVLWSFLNPLLTMGVQYVIFSAVFHTGIPNFAVYLLDGIILFSFFSECVSLGLDSIIVNGALMTKVAMPRSIYPLSRSLSSLINLLISMIPLLLFMLLTGMRFTKAALLIPLAILFVYLFALGMSLATCTLNVFFRDTRFLWGVLVMLWTYATPIFYPETIIPSAYLGLYHCNPMYQFITFLRSITLYGVVPAPQSFLACAVCCLLPLGIGAMIFNHYKDEFVFYL